METELGNTNISTQKSLSSKLDVGCGPHCLPDAVGIDMFTFSGVEHVHDVNRAPWPLESNRFEFIRCQHAIEHFSNVHTVAREMHRVCKDGAVIEFITPHYSSYASWGDPTHVHHFALGSIPILFTQAVGEKGFEVLENKLTFTGSVSDLLGWLIYKMSPRKYEKHWAWISPANEVHTKIRIRK
jgi:SAM-dependent methyltransferase